MSKLLVCYDKLVSTASSADLKLLIKQLKHFEKELETMSTDIDDLPRFGDNVCILQQYQEHLEALQKELAEIRRAIYSFDLDDENDICILQSKIEKSAFDCSLKIRKRLHIPTHFASKADITAATSGVKLPKLDVFAFDGNMLKWRTFSEQFEFAVRSRRVPHLYSN